MARVLLIGCLALLGAWPAQAHQGGTRQRAAFAAFKIEKGALLGGLNLPGPLLVRLLKTPIALDAPPSAAAQRRLMDEVAALVKAENPVLIDGVRVQPTVQRMSLALNLERGALDAPGLKVKGVEVHAGRVPSLEVVLMYPMKAPPTRIDLTWTLDAAFTADGDWPGQPSVALTWFAHRQVLSESVSAAAPHYIWHAPVAQDRSAVDLAVRTTAPPTWPRGLGGVLVACALLGLWRRWPRWSLVVLLALAGPLLWPWARPAPDDARAQEVFAALHRHVYQAFDAATETEIYDALAQGVDGPLLDQIYQEVYQGLLLRDEDGVRSEVQGVKLLESVVQSADGRDGAFGVRARWLVIGEVSHRGHTHRRTHEYSARFVVAPRAMGDEVRWKLVAAEMRTQARR